MVGVQAGLAVGNLLAVCVCVNVIGVGSPRPPSTTATALTIPRAGRLLGLDRLPGVPCERIARLRPQRSDSLQLRLRLALRRRWKRTVHPAAVGRRWSQAQSRTSHRTRRQPHWIKGLQRCSLPKHGDRLPDFEVEQGLGVPRHAFGPRLVRRLPVGRRNQLPQHPRRDGSWLCRLHV